MTPIKIKLKPAELIMLNSMYHVYIAQWESEDGWELLLLEHAALLADRFIRMWRPEAKKYTVKLNAAEALAFWQWWQMIDTSDNILFNAIICRVVGEIDKESKQVLQILEPVIL